MLYTLLYCSHFRRETEYYPQYKKELGFPSRKTGQNNKSWIVYLSERNHETTAKRVVETQQVDGSTEEGDTR